MNDHPQIEMFPKTELDEATEVLQHLNAQVEKAQESYARAGEKLNEAEERAARQRHVVKHLERVIADGEKSLAAGSMGIPVDPATGEILTTEDKGSQPQRPTEAEAAERQANEASEPPAGDDTDEANGAGWTI